MPAPQSPITIPQQDTPQVVSSKSGLKFITFTGVIDGVETKCFSFGDDCLERFNNVNGKSVKAWIKDSTKNPEEKTVTFDNPNYQKKPAGNSGFSGKSSGSSYSRGAQNSSGRSYGNKVRISKEAYLNFFKETYALVSETILADTRERFSDAELKLVLPGYLDAVEKTVVHLCMSLNADIMIEGMPVQETQSAPQETKAETAAETKANNSEASEYMVQARKAIAVCQTKANLEVVKSKILASNKISDSQKDMIRQEVEARAAELSPGENL